MQSSLDRIEKQGKTTTSKISYAAAAQGFGNMPANTALSKDNALKKKRKIKKITVRIENPEEAEEFKKKSSKDILQAAQRAGIEVTGIRQLPSRDVRFHTRSQDVRDTLQSNKEWTKVIAAFAKIQKQTYAVIAHGVRVKNVNTANQSKAIWELQKTNEHLHENLELVQLPWPT